MDDGKLYLGIDYGGNAVKLGLVDIYGQLSGKASIPTKDLLDKVECRAFASEVGDFVHGMGVYSSELGGVGMAIPGIVRGGVHSTPNVKADWPLLLDCISRTFSKRSVAITNDANAAALGELWVGAGHNASSAMLVTIGTGIGSGLVIDGHVVEGRHGAAGEVGHMTVVPDGRTCKCGRKGCVEQYASARGIVRTFREAGASGKYSEDQFSSLEPLGDLDALTVAKAAQEGDPRAIEAYSVMADKLGFALAQVACVTDPAVILLGGGLASGAEIYLDALQAAYQKYALPACSSTEIRCATLLGDAGIIGAARFAMQKHEDEKNLLDPNFGL